jgi:hypothetical protein
MARDLPSIFAERGILPGQEEVAIQSQKPPLDEEYCIWRLQKELTVHFKAKRQLQTREEKFTFPSQKGGNFSLSFCV